MTTPIPTMTPRELYERSIEIATRHDPPLPTPRFVCSWVWDRGLDDGRQVYRCAMCGDEQIVTQLFVGQLEQRDCKSR
jgi:hypothetical protein